MSHLIHIIETKNAMTLAGVSCPKKQSELLNEAFVRALVCARYSKGRTTWSDEFDEEVWVQLEKWNAITAIPARLIHVTAQSRCNEVFSSMARNGIPPNPSAYGAWANTGEADLDMSQLPEYQTLVGYLVRELGAGDE